MTEANFSTHLHAPFSPIFLVLFNLLFIFILCSIFHAYSPKVWAVPGPFFAKFSRVWYLRQVSHRDFQKTNIELHRRYGPVVRIAPNEFSIDDPEAVKIIYGHGTQYSQWYRASGHPNIPDLFTDQNSRRHAVLRRKVASLYSMTTLLRMEPCVEQCTALLTERLREFAQSQAMFNLQYWLQCYAFDLIGLITVAKRFGLLDDGTDPHGLFPSLHSYLVYCSHVGIYNEIHPILYTILSYLGRGGGHLRNFTSEQVQKRIQALVDVEHKPGSGDDFLAKVMQKHGEDPENFTMNEVFVTCMTNIGAGSDTTSISLSAILWYLLKSPEAFGKLRAEIDDMTANGEIADPVTFQNAQRMPYLQAVIKEALRMHPATGLPFGRVVPKRGATIAGTFFPEGSIVGINSWVAHNNTDVFGEDAASFRPERWLQSEERTQKMERYYIPFGHGSRTCIGKNISLMEISVLIPQLVRAFDFELVDPEAELECENLWFVKQKNVFCRVSMRKF
ncbi:cytochrome P450 [Zopfia rhizophila CBS 207.26]|uniref:Cytochrome P450 n=1 Tax=Zopfia rhizophila CBS 207.26 TaxID=1314779 RepID=A0A6A6DA53_9PEZI|nr:cytochrome P450 [Zopfia rhizophila CBS 207.26]